MHVDNVNSRDGEVACLSMVIRKYICCLCVEGVWGCVGVCIFKSIIVESLKFLVVTVIDNYVISLIILTTCIRINAIATTFVQNVFTTNGI